MNTKTGSTTELIKKLSKKNKADRRRRRKVGLAIKGVNSNLTDRPSRKKQFNKKVFNTMTSSVTTFVRMGE